MWIAREIAGRKEEQGAQTARVTLTAAGKVAASGAGETRDTPLYAPYGMASVPPEGSPVLLLPCEGQLRCIGTLCGAHGLEAGEVMLYSAGGARIVLKNNGEIDLNGLTIGKDGRIQGFDTD